MAERAGVCFFLGLNATWRVEDGSACWFLLLLGVDRFMKVARQCIASASGWDQRLDGVCWLQRLFLFLAQKRNHMKNLVAVDCNEYNSTASKLEPSF